MGVEAAKVGGANALPIPLYRSTLSPYTCPTCYLATPIAYSHFRRWEVALLGVTKCHNIPVGIGGDPAQQDPKRSLSGEAQTTATNGNNLSVGHVSGEGRKQAAIGSILGDGAGDFERAKPSRQRGPK
jgi:hypothetical protein